MGEISKETAKEFAHPHEVYPKKDVSIIKEGGEGQEPRNKIPPSERIKGMFQDAEEITLNITVNKGEEDPIIKTIALDEIDSEFEVIGIENGEAKIKFSLKGSYSMFIGENWNLKFKVT